MSTNKPAGGAQFTPGPWAVNKSDTCLIMVSKSMGMGAEKHIADVQYNEERYANAHLIAAAPAMYAAGQLSLDVLMRVATELERTGNEELRSIVRSAIIEQKTALAQAEGKQ